jgi:hypothetical protein
MLSPRNLIASSLPATALGAVGYGLWPKLGAFDVELARQRELPLPDPKMVELVRVATLAANGHNTQPWKFQLTDGRVSILPDFTRRTAVVDPDDHHLNISLGCAAENLTIAAKANGWRTNTTVENNVDTRIEIDLARSQERLTDLYQAIPLRQSTRSEHDSTLVSNFDLKLVVECNGAQMDDPAFVAELRDWIKFTPDQALAGNDGLFSACSGNPVAPSWLAERLFCSIL